MKKNKKYCVSVFYQGQYRECRFVWALDSRHAINIVNYIFKKEGKYLKNYSFKAKIV